MAEVLTPGPAASGPAEGPSTSAGSSRPSWRRASVAGGLLVALGLGLGVLGGVLWWALTDLPSYVVGSNGGANTTERGLAEVLGGDAWFAVIGAVVGLALGLVAWRRLGRVGWPVVLLATGTAALAALLCWAVGRELGPGEFTARLAAAKPGDRVPIELTLQARASLLVWPFFAVIPVLLGSSLGRDEEDPRPAAGPPAGSAPGSTGDGGG
ncbi:hypothetical protein [uncultured Friedmanniella sp.]|uniref:hypothetical protein n=1 Tax=uncultured Friedmanniella sp. TaxID=335381 RepID=UPI0035CB5C67